MYGPPEDRPAAMIRSPVPSDLARDMRSIADDCHMMGMATNVPGWHTVARGFLRCASAFETCRPGSRPTSPRQRDAA